ncbi:hypothetical protein EFP30_14365 [Lactiplantibacillus pentosus]|nr:hypothetical protein [Lactiplantibacillus pentosus]
MLTTSMSKFYHNSDGHYQFLVIITNRRAVFADQSAAANHPQSPSPALLIRLKKRCHIANQSDLLTS